jgi:hypothetical protein
MGSAKGTADKKNLPEKSKKKAVKRKTSVKNPRKTQEKNDVTAIDLCGVKLTAMQHRFILAYVSPWTDTFHNAYKAAKIAGYSEAAAKSDIYGLLHNPNMQRIIRANERLIRDDVHDGAVQALKAKLQRAFFNVKDFYQNEDVTTVHKNGDETTRLGVGLKNLDDMTEEQLICVDGVESKGFASMLTYKMPDRGKELDDIIKLDKDYAKAEAEVNVDGEEETMEIIMERLTVKKTIRKAKDDISETAGLIKRPRDDALITEL